MSIVIVDYGLGNLRSINDALEFVGAVDICISSDKKVIEQASKIILPGVGAFGDAIDRIDSLSLREVLYKHSAEKQKPMLGICLGMQLMCQSSEESINSEGLCLVDGHIVKLDASHKIPHVGFNQIQPNLKNKIYTSFENLSHDFYFTHSYGMQSDNSIGQSHCDYAGGFIASFEVENVVGVQFHPELSQKNGLALMRNFVEKF